MGQRIVPCVAVFIAALLQAACGSFPVNPPLAKYDPSTGYRFKLPPDEGDKRDRLFVILVFSGGGTASRGLVLWSYGNSARHEDPLAGSERFAAG